MRHPARTLLPLAIALGLAATSAGCRPGLQTQTFTLHSLRPSQAKALASPYVLGSNGRVTVSGQPPAITIAGSRRSIEAVRAMLARYDRVPASVRLHYQLVEADGAGATDSSVADVAALLRKMFRYRSYHVVGNALVRMSEGTRATQLIRTDDGMVYRLDTVVTGVPADTGAARMTIETHLQIPHGEEVFANTISGVRSGGVVVVGSARPDAHGALILILRPTIEGQG